MRSEILANYRFIFESYKNTKTNMAFTLIKIAILNIVSMLRYRFVLEVTKNISLDYSVDKLTCSWALNITNSSVWF